MYRGAGFIGSLPWLLSDKYVRCLTFRSILNEIEYNIIMMVYDSESLSPALRKNKHYTCSMMIQIMKKIQNTIDMLPAYRLERGSF